MMKITGYYLIIEDNDSHILMESIQKINEAMDEYEKKSQKLTELVKDSKGNQEDIPKEEIQQMKNELNELKLFVEQQRNLFLQQIQQQRAMFSQMKK